MLITITREQLMILRDVYASELNDLIREYSFAKDDYLFNRIRSLIKSISDMDKALNM